MAVPSEYKIPEYPKRVAGQLVHSPEEEQAALRRQKLTMEAELAAHPHSKLSPTPAPELPSAEDLDKVADEAQAKEDTSANSFTQEPIS